MNSTEYWGGITAQNGVFQGKTPEEIRPDKACHIGTAG
jgi:hypothetical protein